MEVEFLLRRPFAVTRWQPHYPESLSRTHRLLDILLIRHDVINNLPRATSSARSTSMPNPNKVGNAKKYPRCGTKGACETVNSALTHRLRTQRPCQITNYPFPTDPLIATRTRVEMFKVR